MKDVTDQAIDIIDSSETLQEALLELNKKLTGEGIVSVSAVQLLDCLPVAEETPKTRGEGCLEANIRHLSPEAAERARNSAAYKSREGFMLYLGDDAINCFGKELEALSTLARSKGCKWLLIGRGFPVIDGIALSL